ncbi:MAG: anhydro-N-acetylmuramic acid kinase, partial [Bacteroidota bacterium]
MPVLFDSPRTVAGVMSGTSLDGIDVAIVRLDGTGLTMSMEVLATSSTPYPPVVVEELLRQSDPGSSRVDLISQLHARLAELYADAIRTTASDAGLLDDLDLIGCHGQTVFHIPEAEDCAGHPTRSTLQLGDGSVLANRLGVPVVCDFRTADMALGGQGAPLVPYFDYVRFADASERRVLLNLGGIANLTVLPAGAAPSDVFAFDTGTANILLDLAARRFYDVPFDESGQRAATGTVHEPVLANWKTDPYFDLAPPKSTGRELFNEAYLGRLLAASPELPPADALATLAAFSADTVHEQFQRFGQGPADVVIAAGGGVHHVPMMQRLQDRFAD